MSHRSRAAIVLAIWCGAIAATAFTAMRHLAINNDLRGFLPLPVTADQRLLFDQIGEGAGSRLLLVAIGGAPPEVLARLSKGLVGALRKDSRFDNVANGDFDLASIPPALRPYRYLLSPTLDDATFDAGTLRAALQDRVEDLTTPAASLLKPLVASDPTLETLKLAERWAPRHAPVLRDGVWFGSDGAALLVGETRAAGFDAGAQAQAVGALEAAYAALPDSSSAHLSLSGPGYFGVVVGNHTRAAADRIGLVSTAGFIVLLLLAYRSASVLVLAGLPILSGAAAGITVLAATGGTVHGITLAFGFTLLGVAQEYPLRLLSHRRADQTALASTRSLWPLLVTAIVSAVIAFLAFYASGVGGLRQLASFAIAGLLAAGLTTRYVLPHVLPQRFRDAARTPGLSALVGVLDRLPRPRGLVAVVTLIALAMLWLAPGPLWQNDLAALTPVPSRLLQRDEHLRAELGAPDVRYLLVLRAPSAQSVLQLSERIAPDIERLVARDALAGAELPSRYLPSIATQRARQSRLPDRATLAAAVTLASDGLPFRTGLFEPFIDDVERARSLSPMTPAAFEATPLGARLGTMLVQQSGGWLGLVALSGVRDPAAIAAWGSGFEGSVRLLDIKAASESLVAAYRERIAWALGGALVLLGLTVTIALRSARRALHVLVPMTLATLLVVAVERAAGVSLSLFHIVALTLAAGLGLHYALFFERPALDRDDALRTLHATIVCILAALLVFGLQAMSPVPVLRAIGLTVALGVALHFVLSVLIARPASRPPDAR